MIDIKLVKDGDVYYYINKPIDGKKQVITISGDHQSDEITEKVRSIKNRDLYSFVVDDNYHIDLIDSNSTGQVL